MGGGAATGGGGSSLVSPIGSAKQRELPLLRPDFAAATVSRALDSLDGVARSKRLHGGKREEEEEEDSDANLGESKTGPSPIPL